MTLQNSINSGKISQDSNGDIQVAASLNIAGRITSNGFWETYESYTHAFFKPWSETARFSMRLDLYGDNATSELEVSLLRESTTSNANAGLAVYRPNNTNTKNAYISGIGNSFICANNGNFGVGNSAPAYKLDVTGSARFNGSIGFFNKTPIAQQTGGAKTAAATYGTNEQTMLQTVYNALRNFGFLT